MVGRLVVVGWRFGRIPLDFATSKLESSPVDIEVTSEPTARHSNSPRRVEEFSECFPPSRHLERDPQEALC